MFSFHSIILGLLAATCSLQSIDITCGGQFPKAGDGFAKRPDGCSSWSDDATLVRDKWGSANFGGVCDEHDRCYYTRGTDVDVCNGNFCNGLIDACGKAYCRRVPILGYQCVPGIYPSCAAIAGTYCAAVKSVAAQIYAKAQDLQRSYETCIAENGGIALPPPPVMCSNGKPEGATWTSRDGCLTTTYVCRNGRITVTRSFRPLGCIEP